MKLARVHSAVLIVALLTAGFAGGCGDKSSKLYGTYKSDKIGGTLVLQQDHKGTLDMTGTKGDITWELASDDKIIVHIPIPMNLFINSDGSLRDDEGNVWKKS